jgi:hypothetical protein
MTNIVEGVSPALALEISSNLNSAVLLLRAIGIHDIASEVNELVIKINKRIKIDMSKIGEVAGGVKSGRSGSKK